MAPAGGGQPFSGSGGFGRRVSLCVIMQRQVRALPPGLRLLRPVGPSPGPRRPTMRYCHARRLVAAAAACRHEGGLPFLPRHLGPGGNGGRGSAGPPGCGGRHPRPRACSVCVSLGIVDQDFLGELQAAGVHRYHHNVETAASFFPEDGDGPQLQERLATIEAQAAGLAVCVGGIFGLGESVAQRYEMAQTIKELEVDSIPLNFLQPPPERPWKSESCSNPWKHYRLFWPFACSSRTNGSLLPGAGLGPCVPWRH